MFLLVIYLSFPLKSENNQPKLEKQFNKYWLCMERLTYLLLSKGQRKLHTLEAEQLQTKRKSWRFGSIPSQAPPLLLSRDISGLGSLLATLDKRDRLGSQKCVLSLVHLWGEIITWHCLGRLEPNLKSGGIFLPTLVLFGLLLHVKHGAIWPWLLLGKWDVVFCISFCFRLHPTQNILQ